MTAFQRIALRYMKITLRVFYLLLLERSDEVSVSIRKDIYLLIDQIDEIQHGPKN